MPLGQCFVMQPFDKGKYDQRYKEVFEQAIKDAGLEPYRVDNDPAASVPIEEIARQIKLSKVCFAEITTDNPNVWFEIGYGLALGKEVCLICSDERIGKFPFDVQHRQIINYTTNSISDFNVLKSKITARLKAIMDKMDAFSSIENVEPIKSSSGLSHHELSALIVIFENRYDPSAGVAVSSVNNDMEKLGYTKAASLIALEKLRRKEMISSKVETVYDQGNDENYNMTFYILEDKGIEWIIENERTLNLRVNPNEVDIPF